MIIEGLNPDPSVQEHGAEFRFSDQGLCIAGSSIAKVYVFTRKCQKWWALIKIDDLVNGYREEGPEKKAVLLLLRDVLCGAMRNEGLQLAGGLLRLFVTARGFRTRTQYLSGDVTAAGQAGLPAR